MGLVLTKIRSKQLPGQFFLKRRPKGNTTRSKSSHNRRYHLRKYRISVPVSIDPIKDTLLKLCRSERWEEVESIAQSNPEAVFHHDPFSYDSPLHICCALGAPLTTVNLIIDAAPSVTNWMNSRQQLPIHSACFGAKNIGVIHKLLHVNPRSAIALDRSERTPLVTILSSSTSRSKKISLQLLQHFVSKTPPNILRKVDKKSGLLPIDHLCIWMIHNLKFSEIQIIMKISGNGPFLPRHHPDEKYIVSALTIFLKPVPDTAFLAFDQLLKLDCSSRSCESIYLRNTILRYFLQVMNHYQRGNSPINGPNIYLLHHFIHFNLSYKSFYFVNGYDNNNDISTSSSIAMTKASNCNGELPIHILLRKNILQQQNQLKQQKNRNIKIVLRRLIEIYPNAASYKDSIGNYPLHMAILLKGVSYKVIKMLLDNYYPAISEKYIGIRNDSDSDDHRHYNGFYPMLLAACANADISIIYLLLESFPSIMLQACR